MARGFEREDGENVARGFAHRMCEANPCIEPATRKLNGQHYCDDHARVEQLHEA